MVNVIETSHFKVMKNNNNENMAKMLRQQRGSTTIFSKGQRKRHWNDFSKKVTFELCLER